MSRPSTRLSVLVAEDSPPVGLATCAMLSRHWEARLRLVEDGRQAVLAAHSEHWDLILMDLRMPVLDGFEATRQIRLFESLERTRLRLPIIAYTSSFNLAAGELTLVGIDDFLLKPASAAAMARYIEKWTGHVPVRPVW